MIVWRGTILANILSALQPLGGKFLNLAGVAELVDAPDSKSGSGNRVRVRVSPEAPLLKYFSGYNIEFNTHKYLCDEISLLKGHCFL